MYANVSNAGSFPVEFIGATFVQSVGGKQTSGTITGFEFRNGGNKVVFFQDNEAVFKVKRDENGCWCSCGTPVSLQFPTGERLICNSQTCTTRSS